jgi:prepilin-type processing-associated H-X9-DG protein
VVLIALLLPALSKARDAMRAVQCATNERQLYATTLFWVNDHGGFLPGYSYAYGIGWGQQILKSAGYGIAGTGLLISGGYLQDDSIYRCPALAGINDPRNQNVILNGWSYDYAMCSNAATGGQIWIVNPNPPINAGNYTSSIQNNLPNPFVLSQDPTNILNGIAATTTGTYHAIKNKLTMCGHPAETAWFIDKLDRSDYLAKRNAPAAVAGAAAGINWYLATNYPPGNLPPHNKGIGVNVCYFDGHVELVQTVQMGYGPGIKSYDFP